MLRVAVVRVGVGLLTLWAVSIVVFVGTGALPGDAARAALGRAATPGAVAALRAQFHLNRPLLTRYWEWLTGFVQGDLGQALPSGQRVTTLIADPVRNTAVLAGVTIVILIPLALFLGIVSAVRRDCALDHAVAGTTLTMISLPEFVTGSLLAIFFAVWLPWLPAVSLVDPTHSLLTQRSILVLPVATLIIASVAQMTRLIRASMIDVLQSEYVETARLKGVPEWRVLLFHALPNALGPTIQIAAITVAWLAGGVVVTESVFQYNGIGLAFTSAVSSRDLPTVQAIAMLVAAVYVIVNLAADLAVILLNPRLRRPR